MLYMGSNREYIVGGENVIYTSYFEKLKSLPDNIIPISICEKVTNWYTGLQYKKLAPKYNFLWNGKKIMTVMEL